MTSKTPQLRHQRAGTTLVEMIVAAAVSSMLMATLMVGITTIRRTFIAAQHHATSQLEQARLIDYVSRDLRRALSVTPPYAYEGGERLDLTIPDYYDPNGIPRNPVITGGATIQYGSAVNSVAISYYKSGDSIVRLHGGVATPIVTNVQDFTLDFTDGGGQTIKMSVAFVPKFQLSGDPNAARDGTTVYTTTLLRNKRR